MSDMGIHIDADYAGGNIRTVAVNQDVIQLEQELRDTPGWWFYWSFSAQADERREPGEVVFEFMNGEVVGPWGPAVSYDGIHYEWLGQTSLCSRSSFRYRFRDGKERVWFAFGLPYQLHHFERFYAEIAAHPLVAREMLTVSEQLRAVPMLRIGRPDAEEHLLFTCRHHACESTPSYLLEGLLQYFLQQQRSPVLERYAIHYIPFVDIDGVEKGDQGKSRMPHDHNRDYTESPIYRSTAAIMRWVQEKKPLIGIDFHGPNKWGGRSDHMFFVMRADPIETEIMRLSRELESVTAQRTDQDAILHDPAYNIQMGVDWNQPNSRLFSAFLERSGAKLATTFEFPYFGAVDSPPYTTDNCRQFGADMARALERYLL